MIQLFLSFILISTQTFAATMGYSNDRRTVGGTQGEQTSTGYVTVGSGGTTFLSDTFTDSDSTAITSHTGEVGATWTKHPGAGYSAGSVSIQSNRAKTPDGNTACYYASGSPDTANYSVSATIFAIGTIPTGFGPAGRIDTTADTMYFCRRGTTAYQLYRMSAGSATLLDSESQSGPTTNDSEVLKLEMLGDQIKCYSDGVLKVSATDANITAAGRAGIRGHSNTNSGYTIDSVTAINE